MPGLSEDKHYEEASVFLPENLLREARRQKKIEACSVPQVIVLDPDGDMVRYLKKRDAVLNRCWACYHSELYNATYKNFSFGIIGCAVGAAYAVLLAEQLFVSGCELLISVTSAGKLSDIGCDYILINRTLRDEGTSYHYLPSDTPCSLNEELLRQLLPLLQDERLSLRTGDSWTTDAPFRETASAIARAKAWGADSVEMEASALYAFAKAKGKKVVCYGHLTNSMAQQTGDFEKGVENGSLTSLELIFQTAKILKVHE